MWNPQVKKENDQEAYNGLIYQQILELTFEIEYIGPV